MKPMPDLTELARLIHDSETIEEFWGALREWAHNIVHPLPQSEFLSINHSEVAYIEMLRQCNYRQQWALQEAAKWGRITSPLVARRFDISMESARLDLHDLVEQGRLIPISNKKGRYYVPVHPNTDDSAPLSPQGIGEGVPQAPLQAKQDTLPARLSEY